MGRQQELMRQAIEHISAHKGDPEDQVKIYGGLYHKLPVLIRTCGLCQALAFLDSKSRAEGARAEAHKAVLRDVSDVLGTHWDVSLEQSDGASLSEKVSEVGSREYALATRILLQSLVFHKRFAESILGVEATDYSAEDNVAEEEEAQVR